ncbi:MAG: hypothetical protein JNK82_22430 [Myxococcaceae bacterium]|nr:hypothetical protein [Myxococcaceae bacterium]
MKTVVISSATGATLRIAPRLARRQAVVEVMDTAGEITQVRVSPDDLRRIAAAFMKVAAALETANASEETTRP